MEIVISSPPQQTELESQLHQIVTNLIETYKDDEYIIGRLRNYMQFILPATLENAAILFKQRDERKKLLHYECEDFIRRFLHTHRYSYCPQTELYMTYENGHFSVYHEDDITHKLLSAISNSTQNLAEWKQRVKIKALKLIRELSPLNCIPESDTIQFVLNRLYPVIFSTKNQAKYFLTVIGDALLPQLKKQVLESNANAPTDVAAGLTYFINPAMKEMIREICNQGQTYFGSCTLLNILKFKFHEHAYAQCRLIPTNTLYQALDSSFYRNLLDFFCVAAHYSHRYGSADKFLAVCSDPVLVEQALYLSKRTPESVVKAFVDKSIQDCPAASISSKNMIFLWKKYILEQGLPNVLFQETLKVHLKNVLKYDESRDVFLDVTSFHLPIVALFTEFWQNTMIVTDADDNDNDNHKDEDEDDELEIDELSLLFKQYSPKNGHLIGEQMLIELIHHFFPDVVMEEQRYIRNIRNERWDKKNEVLNALELFKIQCSNDAKLTTTSLYDAYTFYCDRRTNNGGGAAIRASKRYFEWVANENLNESYLDKITGIINEQWWKVDDEGRGVEASN